MLDRRVANLTTIHITGLVLARSLFDHWAYSVQQRDNSPQLRGAENPN